MKSSGDNAMVGPAVLSGPLGAKQPCSNQQTSSVPMHQPFQDPCAVPNRINSFLSSSNPLIIRVIHLIPPNKILCPPANQPRGSLSCAPLFPTGGTVIGIGRFGSILPDLWFTTI